MRERTESGLTIKAYCEQAGFHENIYYYWQRKLREAASEELSKKQGTQVNITHTHPVFTEVKLTEQISIPSSPGVAPIQNQILIEAAGIRITADSEYPVMKLADLMREVLRPC
jgi:transposase-like protein